jgi:Flp pilus assembly protein protease CpaA
MIYFIILFMMGAFLIGLFTSYMDIKKGIIRNKIILFGFFYFLIIFSTHLLFFDFSFNLIFFVFQNFLVSFLLAFMLFFFSFWTAGDAKLFILFSLFLSGLFLLIDHPFKQPFILLLLFTFVPYYFYFSLNSIYLLGFKKTIIGIIKAFSLKNIFNTALVFFVIAWPMSYLSIFENIYFLSFLNNVAVRFILIIILFYFIMQIIDEKYFKYVLIFFIIIAILRLFFDKSVYDLKYIFQFTFFVLFFVFFRYFLIECSFSAFSYDKKINSLKKLDLPAEIIYKIKGGYKKQPISYMGFSVFSKEKDAIYDLNPAGFSLKDIKQIKELYLNNKFDFDKIKIYRVIPFAPFLFFGFVLSFLMLHFWGYFF